MSSILRSTNYLRRYFNLNHSLNSITSLNKFTWFSRSNLVAPVTCSFTRNVSDKADLGYASVEDMLMRLDHSVKQRSRVTMMDLERVLGLMKRDRSLTPTEATLVLRSCGGLLPEVIPEERRKIVEELLKTFQSQGLKFDILYYNTLLAVYFENGNVFTPAEFLLELEEKGIKPDRITYQRLIAGCCNNGDLEGATKILEFMKEKGLSINEHVFNSLILAHSKLNDLESAEGIIDVMKEAGVPPSAETYATLLCAHAKVGNIDKINKLIADCENSDLILRSKDFLKVVYELATNGHKDLIPEILRKVETTTPDFNQEVVNVSLQLISIGHEDVAFQLSQSLSKTILRFPAEESEENVSFGGYYFARQLVKCHRPLEKVKQYLELLVDEYSNPLLYNVAMKEAARVGDLKYAKEIYKLAEAGGAPIRPHYFWPLLKKESNKKNSEGIYQVLDMMMRDFNMTQLRDTLREYVVPDLMSCGESWQTISGRLLNSGLASGTVANAVVLNLLLQNQIIDAAEIMMNVRAYYQPYFIRAPAVSAYLETRNLGAFINIMKVMHQSVIRQEQYRDQYRDNVLEGQDADENTILVPDKTNMISKMVFDVTGALQRDPNSVDEIHRLFKALLDNGLGISEQCAHKVLTWLKPIMTPELADIIERLASDNLHPTPLPPPTQTQTRLPSQISDVDEKVLRQILEQRVREGKPVDGVRRQLLHMYCRANDLEKALEMKQELEESGFSLNVGEDACLIDVFLTRGDLERAQELFNKHKERDPNFHLDYAKSMKLCALLIKNDKIEEAEKILEGPIPRREDDDFYSLRNHVRIVLNAVEEKDDPELAEKIVNLLLSKGHIESNSLLYGVVIKAHLNRGDLNGALSRFEHYCRSYKVTPLKHDLTKQLIKAEDAAALQRLTDLSTEVHGEINSLLDLVQCFLELGRSRQARKILETPGLRARQLRLDKMCKSLSGKGDDEALKRLIDVTKGIPDVDRSAFYVELLDLYGKTNDVDKAYDLYLSMQEADEIISDTFLFNLANILKNNGREVPFHVPAPPVQTERIPEPKIKSSNQRFKRFLEEGDLDNALRLINQPDIPAPIKMNLVTELVRAGRSDEGMVVLSRLLNAGSPIKTLTLKQLAEEFVKHGHHEMISKLKQMLPEDQKEEPFTVRSMAEALKVAGKYSEMLKELETGIAKLKPEKINWSIPIKSLIDVVAQEPKYLPEVEVLCEKVKDKSPLVSAITLWNIYTTLDVKPEERNQLLGILSQTEGNFFEASISRAERLRDITLIDRVKEALWSATSLPNLANKRGRIVTGEIRLLTLTGQTEEALNRLESALKEIDIFLIQRNPLYYLKQQAERKNLPFNYDISHHPRDSDRQAFTQ